MTKRYVSHDWIYNTPSLEHWLSYYYQIQMVQPKLTPGDRLIELGPGDHTFTSYFRNRGYFVITVDVDVNKRPDIVIDATQFKPLKPFEYFCAFEVFEHLPFDELNKVMNNLAKCITKGVFVSVPVNKKHEIDFYFHFRNFRKWITIPTPKSKVEEGHHYWELGFKNYTMTAIEDVFNNNGFVCKERRRFHRWQYWYFVVK